MNTESGIYGISRDVQRGRLRARQVVEDSLARIDCSDDQVGAFLYVNREGALAGADEQDRQIARGANPGPLAGVPVGIKDIFMTEGLPSTCGSQILRDYVPPYDAEVVARLKRAGVVVVGKMNMDEFAMGSSSEHSGFKPVHNPWNLACVPGGSSGGSAAAVAARMVPLSIGSDTGGSIRQPAAMCGVVGFKPTYGRVSRYGLAAFASSLDTPGPIGLEVRDCALALQVMAGHDPRDSTSFEAKVPDYIAALGRGVQGMRIGIPDEYFGQGTHPHVRDAVERAIQVLVDLGASTTRIGLRHTEFAVAAYYIVACAEASSNLARYDGMRYGVREPGPDLPATYTRTRSKGFGSEVKRRILLGTYVLSVGYRDKYYLKALRARTLIKQDFQKVFDAGVDVIVTPTSPCEAFRIGEKVGDPLSMYQTDVCTLPASLAGLPAVSVPCGFSRNHMPLGMQIIGRPLAETDLFAAAAAYEEAAPWWKRLPEGFEG